MTISAVLTGGESDAGIMQSVLLMAARDGYDVKVIMAARFPKTGFLKLLDGALGRLALLGLPAPAVAVERQRDGPGDHPATAIEPPEPLRFPVEAPSFQNHSRSIRSL